MESSNPIETYISSIFYTEYLDALKEAVRIPSLSPAYDPQWQENKNLMKQADHMKAYFEKAALQGAKIEIIQDEGRSPFIIVNVQPFDGNATTTVDGAHSVLLYGHLDKQPVGEGWNTDPWEPTIKDGKLYGRGGCDDCYAFFSCISAIKACQVSKKKHPRIVITIEGSEEGEVDDLVHYLGKYKEKLGNPYFLVCLDSGAALPNSMMMTTSLRGFLDFNLKAKVSENFTHSGLGGGIVPNPYQILNAIIGELCDPKTQVVNHQFHVEIPEHRQQEYRYVANLLPQKMSQAIGLLPGERSLCALAGDDKEQSYQEFINNTWRPSFAVLGQQGIPSLVNGGNVILKEISFKCALRLPPTLSGEKAKKILEEIVYKHKTDGGFDYTWGAQVELTDVNAASGFNSPKLPDDLQNTLSATCKKVFGGDTLNIGMGGSIPFIEIFAQAFPGANFAITGCVFANSNIHAANENLDLEYCRKFTTAIGTLLSEL